MNDNTFFWICIILYISIMALRVLFMRFCTTNRTRVIFRNDENGNEIQVDRNIHIIILTNHENSDMDIVDIENQDEELIDKCPICYDLLNNNIIKTECNHKFHKPCLLTWIGSGQRNCLKCPICIQNLSL